MTAGSPFVFPSSRVLAGWWKHFASLQPRALWVGHLLLHHVEASVTVRKPIRLDALTSFALKALALTPGSNLEEVDRKLHLGAPLLRQLMRQLEADQLVQSQGPERWSLTSLGQEALAQGAFPRTGDERRSFFFVESDQAERAPPFLPLGPHPLLEACRAGENWHFDAGILETNLRQSSEWKRQHGFPLDITALVTSNQAASLESSWQHVILDRPERLIAALALMTAKDGGERLLGFGVQQDNWVLQTAEPVFALQGDWREVLADLVQEPALEAWRQAWRNWCQPRGLSLAEVDACNLERSGYRLRITASARLIELLRETRSDALKGEAWLQAGPGRVRAVALVELVAGKF